MRVGSRAPLGKMIVGERGPSQEALDLEIAIPGGMPLPPQPRGAIRAEVLEQQLELRSRLAHAAVSTDPATSRREIERAALCFPADLDYSDISPSRQILVPLWIDRYIVIELEVPLHVPRAPLLPDAYSSGSDDEGEGGEGGLLAGVELGDDGSSATDVPSTQGSDSAAETSEHESAMEQVEQKGTTAAGKLVDEVVAITVPAAVWWAARQAVAVRWLLRSAVSKPLGPEPPLLPMPLPQHGAQAVLDAVEAKAQAAVATAAVVKPEAEQTARPAAEQCARRGDVLPAKQTAEQNNTKVADGQLTSVRDHAASSSSLSHRPENLATPVSAGDRQVKHLLTMLAKSGRPAADALRQRVQEGGNLVVRGIAFSVAHIECALTIWEAQKRSGNTPAA